MGFRQKYPENKFPFSDELCAFMESNPEFYNSLKIANTERFYFLKPILTSFVPNHPTLSQDEVLGFFYFDIKTKIFKQDFIINKDKQGKSFYSYVDEKTYDKYKSCPYVLLINNFFKTYGENGKYYHRQHEKPWMHHYKNIIELPGDILQKNAEVLISNIKPE